MKDEDKAWVYPIFCSGFLEPNTDKEQFEKWKNNFEEKKREQIKLLRSKICPQINAPCIGCDCLSYVEPDIWTVECEMHPFLKWLTKGKTSLIGRKGEWKLARCYKEVF